MIFNWSFLIYLSIPDRYHILYVGIVTTSGTRTTLNISNYRPEAGAQEELQTLAKPCYATQWNAALYEDACLLVVPGSHRRARTAEERKVTLEGDGRGVMSGYSPYHFEILMFQVNNGSWSLLEVSYFTTITSCTVRPIQRLRNAVKQSLK